MPGPDDTGLIRNIPSLDGFRAISIFLVVAGHIFLITPLPEELSFLSEFFNLSGLGVSIFFVISGFLITYLLLQEREKSGAINYTAFYKRRFLRIFPAFYAYLIVITILNVFFALRLHTNQILGAGLYLQNFEFWKRNWYVDHSWSLAVEEQFYLIWPFLFFRLPNLRKVRSVVIITIACSIVRSIDYKFPDVGKYLGSAFLMHADFLFTGCFLAYQYFYNPARVRKFIQHVSPIFVLVAAIVLWLLSIFTYHPVYDKILIPISGPIGCLCIAFLLLYFISNENSLGYRFLNAEVVKFMGRISYSLYLWQQLFISDLGLWVTTFPQNIILTILTALSSYYLIERPFLRMKEKLRIL